MKGGCLFVQLHPTPNGFYEPGQNVSGAVVFDRRRSNLSSFHLSDELYVQVKGRGKVQWSNADNKFIHKATQSYLLLKIPVIQDLTKLPQGKVMWLPFIFQLPLSIPSSYEGEHGHVRYTVKAVLKRCQLLKRNVVCKTSIVIKKLDRLIQQTDSIHLHQVSICQSGYWPKSNDRVSQEWIKVNAWIDKGFYVPGETIQFSAQIENCGEKSIRNTKVEFIQYSVFTAGSSHVKVKTVLWEQFGVKIHPGSIQTWDNVPITVPSSASPTSLPHCDLIDICYMLKLISDPGLLDPSLINRIKVVIGNPVDVSSSYANEHRERMLACQENLNKFTLQKLSCATTGCSSGRALVTTDLDSSHLVNIDSPPPTYTDYENNRFLFTNLAIANDD